MNEPTGASMSTTVSAKLCVAAGGSPQLNAGEVSVPSQVNVFGMEPDGNSEVVSSMAGVPSLTNGDGWQPARVKSVAARLAVAAGNFRVVVIFCLAI